MDKILHPHMRKWISEPLHLGDTIKDLRNQVRCIDELAAVAGSKAAELGKDRYNKEKVDNEGRRKSKSRKSTVTPATTCGTKLKSEIPSNTTTPVLASEALGRVVPGTSSTNSTTINSSNKRSGPINGVSKLMTSEEKMLAKAGSSRLNELLGGDKFFIIKKKKDKKKKGKQSEDSDAEVEEEQCLESLFASGLSLDKQNSTECNDSEDSDGPGYRAPSVRDYFSDFSNLSEDSEEDYDDDYEDEVEDADYRFRIRVDHYKNRVFDRYTQSDSSDSEDYEMEENETDLPQTNTHNDGEKDVRNPLEPEEEIDKGDRMDGPSTNKRRRFAETENETVEDSNDNSTKSKASNSKSYGNDRNDVDSDNIPTNLNENACDQGPGRGKKVGGDEQFVPFMDRVFRIKKHRDASFQEENIDDISLKMNIPVERCRSLRDKMNIDSVSVKGETFQEEPIVEGSVMPVLAPPLPDSAKSQLQSLAIFVTHGDDPTGFQWRSNNVQQQINDDIRNVAFQKRMTEQEQDYNRSAGLQLVDKGVDFLIEMSVYQAGDPDETLPDDVKSYAEPKLAYKLELLGRQTVAELRDAMHCENDLMSVKEVEHPKFYRKNSDELAKNKYPTAAIIIGDTIYSDLRKPGGINFAESVNKWASSLPPKNIGPFIEGDLVSTKLQDLTVRFGYPYLYTHMGNCEHVVVFNKARLLEKKDEHRISRYPRVIPSSTFKSIYCRVDNEYLAKWAVLDNADFPEDPMMVCTECLTSYCYDAKGKKRGNFRVFPFRQLANEL